MSQFRCKGTIKHEPGRGDDLKRTEEYMFKMTDAVHRVLKRSMSEAYNSQSAIICCAIRPSYPPCPTMANIKEIIASYIFDQVPFDRARGTMGGEDERPVLRLDGVIQLPSRCHTVGTECLLLISLPPPLVVLARAPIPFVGAIRRNLVGGPPATALPA